METCPVCRASLNGASTCRRCRADLQKVQEVERRGQALAGAAMRPLPKGTGRWRTLARSRTGGSRDADGPVIESSSLAVSDRPPAGRQRTTITDN